MGCHFCQDELFGFIATLGVFKFAVGYIRAAWAARHTKPTCHHEHDHVHEITDDMIVEEK